MHQDIKKTEQNLAQKYAISVLLKQEERYRKIRNKKSEIVPLSSSIREHHIKTISCRTKTDGVGTSFKGRTICTGDLSYQKFVLKQQNHVGRSDTDSSSNQHEKCWKRHLVTKYYIHYKIKHDVNAINACV